jgi:hypothetical protein
MLACVRVTVHTPAFPSWGGTRTNFTLHCTSNEHRTLPKDYPFLVGGRFTKPVPMMTLTTLHAAVYMQPVWITPVCAARASTALRASP